MSFCIIYLVLTVILHFANCTIIIQAPKYVPKKAIEGIVRKYYLQLRNGRMLLDSNKGIEIEIPVKRPLSQQYRFSRRKERPSEALSKILRILRKKQSTLTPTTAQITQTSQIIIEPVSPFSPPLKMLSPPVFLEPDLHYALTSESLRRAEEAVAMHLDDAITEPRHPPTIKPVKEMGSSVSYQREIYQEDVQKALDELEARLKFGGSRPATFEDLMKMVEEVEKKILEKQEMLATSTPDPCEEEKILQEALKPALQEDLLDMIKMAAQCGRELDLAAADKDIEESHKAEAHDTEAIELTVRKAPEIKRRNDDSHEEILNEARRNIGQEFIELLQAKLDNYSNSSTVSNLQNSQHSLAAELIDLLKHGVEVEEDPGALEEKGLIPIRIEIPKSFKDIIIKT